MVKWTDDYLKFIKSEWFEFITLVPFGWYIFVFIIIRATIIGSTTNLVPYYLSVHLYTWLSLVVIIIYNPFKRTFDEKLERRRDGNGEVRMDPFIWMILVTLSLGFATLPFWLILRRRDRGKLKTSIYKYDKNIIFVVISTYIISINWFVIFNLKLLFDADEMS